MSSRKFCQKCNAATEFTTDYGMGQILCSECGYIIEENILVSEVGFAEGSGGRVHVQGSFVSHHATGIGGLRGRNSLQSTENIKSQGQLRIGHVAAHMGLGHSVKQGAQRLFALAVDANFHRGRRKDYVVASCLYFQSRLKKEPHMLIDFSERLQINVFELGGCYLKLRATLCLTDPMPMTDPAIYSLRFANRLDLGTDKHKVATDASRLVRRFQADWMSEGRRPAGVCGACLLVAARMNGHHRTPEEIAQIVKVSSTTVKRRLLEFAQTDMASKTVDQWKSMSDKDLDAPGEAQPPVVKAQEARAAKRRKLALVGKRGSRAASQATTQADPEEEPSDDEGRQIRTQVKNSQIQDALQAAAAQLKELGEEEEEDMDLAFPAPGEYVRDLDAAGDNPEEAINERKQAVKKFKRANKFATGDSEDLEDLQDDIEAIVEDGEKEDEVQHGDDDQEVLPEDGGDEEDPRMRYVGKFDQWDDPEAVRKHVEAKYMVGVQDANALTDRHMQDRLSLWLGVRDPKEVMYEFEVVKRAYTRREKEALKTETEFEDIDDDEIDGIWKMEEEEQKTRGRMWLSQNGKWLEEDKEKQWKRDLYQTENADKIARRKNKKKQKPAKRTQPYNTAREAMQGLSVAKNFSSRLNVAALREMGMDIDDADDEDLERMDEKNDVDDEKADDEKYDHTQSSQTGYQGYADYEAQEHENGEWDE